ncbi:MAG: ATP-binding protein [Acidimicrobiia bacterium]|nr:ATP-binding protein [Acidimicrobiia bacterium]
MTHTRQTQVRTSRIGPAVLSTMAVVVIIAGLGAVVVSNLQTSADIRKESREAHLLGEMHIAFTVVEQSLAIWTAQPGEVQPPSEDPDVAAATANFERYVAELLSLIDADEVALVQGFADSFDAYLLAVVTAGADPSHDQGAAVFLLEREVRSPLLALLHEENEHLLESVEAGRRSEQLLRWGLPALLAMALILSYFVVRLQGRSQALEEERKLTEARNQFIASVSHELRTPLTPIVALSHELRDRVGDFSADEMVEFADMIARESDAVSAIVDDLLVAARIDAGELSITTEVLDIAEEIAHALTMIDGSDDISVEASGAVLADGGRLRQILRNLISNAYRYGGAQVTVTGHREGERMVVVVSDSGSGIPPELRDRIFEPFARAHDFPGVPASVGLGLTVSRTLANLMGGTLSYAYEGGWSRLILVLPVPSKDLVRA